MLDKSPELKVQRGYRDPKSFVRLDGSEVLVRADWKKRKQELWWRCGGQCEYKYPNGARCREDCVHPHHTPVPRWKKRIDNLENLMGVCAAHHRLLDGRLIGGRRGASK